MLRASAAGHSGSESENGREVYHARSRPVNAPAPRGAAPRRHATPPPDQPDALAEGRAGAPVAAHVPAVTAGPPPVFVVGDRQRQREDRAPFALAPHADLAAVLLEDLLRDREPNARSALAAHRERHEELFEQLARIAQTVV